VQELLAALTRLLREEKLAAIIVEQHAQKILPITQRALILERGRIVHQSDSAALLGRSGAARTVPRSHRPVTIFESFETFENSVYTAPALSQHPAQRCSTQRRAGCGGNK
jgi:energy-coupling factor transporter ATP-binding protein EcfA2